MSEEVKYELVLEQTNEVAKAMKNLYDVLGIRPRETERIVKSAPIVVSSFLSKDEACSKKEELESDGSAEYSINEVALKYRVIIEDFDFARDASKISKVLPALCQLLDIELNEAKKLCDNSPLVVKDDISLKEAEDLKSELLDLLDGVCEIINVEADL